MNKQLLSFIILGIVLAVPVLAVSSDNIITQTISNVTDFIVQITIGLAALAYVAAGLFHMTATGNATKINTARDIALYTTIGLVIILMAKGFISIVETLVAK
jgi:hypothetical protein